MVIIHDINGSKTEIKAQHIKCKKCSGTKVDCLEFVKCSYAICGNQYHVRCLESLNDTSELAEKDFWYCSGECENADEPNRNLQSTSNASLLAENSKLNAELSQLRLNNSSLDANYKQLQASFKLLENQLAHIRLSSTLLPQARDAALDTSAMNVTSSLDATISHLLDISQINAQHLSAQSATSGNASTSSNTSTVRDSLNSKETTNAHTVASIVLSLSERRKHLPELPEFNGKGSEWLCFRNSYHKLQKLGKFDDDEMIAKLRKSLKGSAFEFARMWLFSARSNPAKIILDLEERFFSPAAVITDSFDAISVINPIKEKTRDSIEKLKRAVDEYINVCNDVEETIHLTGRVPESIEDKLPDDLLEDWIKNMRTKVYRGDWYDFSRFLTESTRDLKVRAVDRKKIKSTSTSSSSSKSSSSTARVNAIHLIGKSPPCDFDGCDKPLFRCPAFAGCGYEKKVEHLTKMEYCHRCLRQGHLTASCPNVDSLPPCRAPGCKAQRKHTTVMHPPSLASTSTSEKVYVNVIHGSGRNGF